MNSNRLYFFVALAAMGVMIIMWLQGLQREDPLDSPRLWKEDWQVIEYYEGQGKWPRFRFFREHSLLYDRYYVEVPVGFNRSTNSSSKQKAKQPDYLRFAGSYLVKNIFSDWRQPVLLSYFQKPDKQAKKQQIESQNQKQIRDTGLESSDRKIYFYTSPTSKPLRLKLGSKAQQGRFYVQSSREPALVFILSSYLQKRFDKEPLEYRTRLILDLPRKSYIEDIAIRLNNIDETKAQSFSRLELQQREIKKEGKTSKLWTRRFSKGSQEKAVDDSKATTEIPLIMGIGIASSLKQLRITHFADEEGLVKYGSSKQLWQEAKLDFITAQVDIKRGEDYLISIRKPKHKISLKKANLYLIKTSTLDQIYFIDITKIEHLLKQYQKIKDYIPLKPKAPVESPASNTIKLEKK